MTEEMERANNYNNGPVWNKFGLTYASYFVMPRAAMCSMPVEWQERFVALIEEAEELLPEGTLDGDYWVRLKQGNRFVSDPLSDYRHVRPLELRKKEGKE